MQASWIDADELRALATGLQDPVEERHDEVWILEPLLNDDGIAEEATPSLSPSTPPAPIARTPVSEPTVELQTLHEQLRIIREQAQAAGLLPVVSSDGIQPS